MITRFLQVVMLILLLGSCATNEVKEETAGTVMEIPSLVDRDKFIADSKKRSETDAKYGPVVEGDVQPVDIRDSYNVQIDVEESLDYVDMYDDGSGKVFPIDLNIENMDIRTFTQMLSKITGVNILVSEEVGGYITAKLEDVSWPNALDSILKLKSLAKHVNAEANIMRIHDQQTIVELETFDRQRRQDLQTTMVLARAAQPLYTEVFKLFYTKPSEVKTILEGVFSGSGAGGEGGGATVSSGPQVTVDQRMNALIIKGRKEDLTVVKKLIAQLDARTKQIFIEAFVVEVTDDFEKKLGSRLGVDFQEQWETLDNQDFIGRVTGVAGAAGSTLSPGDTTATVSNLAVAAPMGGISFLLGLGGAMDLKAELSAMQDEGLTRVVSNPRIFTLDNQEAVIFQGTEVPYETVSDSGTSIQFKQAGLRLAVTPTVVGDGNLLMSLAVNKDTVDTSIDNPPITKSEITTNLVTRDGSIVVIGGIYTETKIENTDKVPFFGDLPGAKALFRHEQNTNNKKELMIFIAPRII